MPEPAAKPPLILAVDTATEMASLALSDGVQMLAEVTWRTRRDHSSSLLGEIQRALASQGRSIADVTVLGVACGPGSFTGVRVGLSVVKGLAFALSLPAFGFSTLQILASSVPAATLPVRTVVAAGRGRVVTALFRGGKQVEQPFLCSADALPSLAHEPTI